MEKQRVIIVGNSSSILLQENGSIIDEYDVVVRINHCPTEGYEKFIGKKIDIWSTTKNSIFKDKFVPTDFLSLSQIWHRTGKTKNNSVLPKHKIPEHIMYKTRNFEENFGSYINSSDKNHNIKYKWCLKGTEQELCTGLITILTSTLFYNDVTIFGFTFYTEQKDDSVVGYYRDKQLDENGKHFEDVFWKQSKDSGFASLEIGNKKKKIIEDLLKSNRIKLLNEKELEDLRL
jgi:hypothetical protein